MSQKYIKTKNKNSQNSKSYGKYYAKPVYDQRFIETDDIADFIQTQATLKRSDIKAALDELGAAIKHFLEMGQKVRLAGIGIFKVGFSSIGVTRLEDCTASTITTRRVLFQPEIERIVIGSAEKEGKIIQKYVNAKTLVKDVTFEETHDNSMNQSSEQNSGGQGSTGGTGSITNGGSQNSGNSGNAGNSGSQEQQSGYALTISKTGTGSASVTLNGNAVSSGSNLNENDEVAISITPAEGQTPTASLNGSSIELTESDGVYSGSFSMPAQASTLVISTGIGSNDDGQN